MDIECARRGSASNRHIRHILLGHACALAIGLAMTLGSSPASAQFYQYLYPYQRPHKIKHNPVRKHVEQQVSKLPFGDIPKGPLEIFVSIEQQKLHLYSDGVLVATEPVATGVPGHLTPLGVFSVIERDRYHHSNLYSNAPMPYMERITWSGVALHEGPGVGRQASHGCIRMPQAFAAKLWMLPTMGMRVIIARQELRPMPFTDSHLFVHKELPPTAALPHGVETAQQVAPGTKSDAEPSAAAPAGGAGAKAAAPDPVKAGAAAPDAAPSAPPDLRLNPAPAAAATPRPAAADKPAAKDAAAPVQPAAAAPDKAAQTPAPASPPVPAAATASPQPTPATPPVPGAAANAPTAADMTAPIAIDNVPIPLTKPAQIAKGSDGPIAIFVSRKAGRIYVRQNFAPLFDAPVTIEHPEQALGTHVYTAMDYLPDHSAFRWTVVTLPTATASRKVERWKYVKDAWGRRRRVRVEERVAEPENSQPAAIPAEALARIQIPQDVIGQISQLMVPGSSLVVSDQGLGSETGVHTDFIVVTR